MVSLLYVFDHRPATIAFVVTFGIWVVGERVLTVRDWRSGALRTKQDAGSFGWAFAFIVCGVVGGFALAESGFLKLPGPLAWVVVGLVVAWAGMVVRAWAVRTLGRSFTTKVLVRTGQRVVSTGPYRWVRHPSYLGLLILLFGMGLALGSPVAAVVMVVVSCVGLVRRITVEETALKEGLGDSYAGYCHGRARLVPHIW